MTGSPADLVITGCTVLVRDEQEGIGFEEDAAVVVRGGVVESVTEASAVRHLAAAERIDGHGQVAMPGLINCHTHAPMVALRGVAEDLPTEEWFNDVVWPVESNLTERDVELGARLACAEMIRGGVTCFADRYFAMDAVAAVVEECGIRAHLGEAYFSSQGPRGREKSLEFALDVPAVVRELGERMPALLDRGHGRRIQDYKTWKPAREKHFAANQR